MYNEDLTVFADTQFTGTKCESVSFGCVIHVLSGNNLRYALNIYAKENDMAVAHLLAHMYSVAMTHKAWNIRFSIAMQAPLTRPEIAGILRKCGIVEDNWHNCCEAQLIGIVKPIKLLIDKYASALNVKLTSLL